MHEIELQRKIIRPVVAIIFNAEGKILMTQRDEQESKFHGLWQVPGGGMEEGESPHQTALREVREEVGLIVKLLKKEPFVFSHVDETDDRHTVVSAFPAKHISGEIDISNDPHTGKALWMHYEEIDFANTIPLTKECIDEALRFQQS